jgi:UDP-2,3-diacylglucosamine pyrophosphatase LpxH
MTTRLVVLSDLHIAPAGPLASFHAGSALANLLHANARADTTLFRAGEVFDFLQIERPAGSA